MPHATRAALNTALARLREFYARDQATLKAIKKARRGGVPRACKEVDRLIEM